MRVVAVLILFFGWLAYLPTIPFQADDKKMMEEIRKALPVGMDRQAVEAFFNEHKIPHWCSTREEMKGGVPEWHRKSPDAVGTCSGRIDHVRDRYPFEEGISIEVEIDSKGKATQVLVKPFYRGL
jgi:hypothetical protein